jgi:hypothetical protein
MQGESVNQVFELAHPEVTQHKEQEAVLTGSISSKDNFRMLYDLSIKGIEMGYLNPFVLL